jgi:uncharacterized protein (DUF2141 family)
MNTPVSAARDGAVTAAVWSGDVFRLHQQSAAAASSTSNASTANTTAAAATNMTDDIFSVEVAADDDGDGVTDGFYLHIPVWYYPPGASVPAAAAAAAAASFNGTARPRDNGFDATLVCRRNTSSYGGCEAGA